MPAITSDQVLALVQQLGPSLPTDITSRTRQDSMIIGALLSTLVAEKRMKITSAKWGGSPLYYTPEQFEQIQKIYPQLNEKDRRAFDLLKANGVLEDTAQTPLVRACLRQIKDFSIPLTVTGPDGKEFLFWKWYMLADADAKSKIMAILTPLYETQVNAAKAASAAPASQVVAPANVRPVAPAASVAQTVAPVAMKVPVSKPVAKVQAADDDFIGSPMLDAKLDAKQAKAAAAKPVASVPATAPVVTAVASTQSAPVFHGQSILAPLPTGDDFFVLVSKQLAEKQVVVSSATVVKKNSELDLLISMPTPFGPVNYYAKARKKKKSTDADLSSVYVKGQMLHLPTAYISLGELTKKAQEMLKKDFAGVLVITLSE